MQKHVPVSVHSMQATPEGEAPAEPNHPSGCTLRWLGGSLALPMMLIAVTLNGVVLAKPSDEKLAERDKALEDIAVWSKQPSELVRHSWQSEVRREWIDAGFFVHREV